MTILADIIYDSPVKPWTLVPILSLIIGIISMVGVYFLVTYLKRHEKDKILNILIFVYGILFFGLELYHQITRYYALGHYDWSSIPFQFCSIPIYLCLILPFIKSKKAREPFFYYLAIYCMISGVFPLLFGQAALCRWPTVWGAIRSFIWHFLILHVSMLALAYRPIAFNLKKTWRPMLGCIGIFIGLTIIAQIINVTLHYGAGGVDFANPANQAFKDYNSVDPLDPDQAGCFYISPYYISVMPVFHEIYGATTWYFNWFIYDLSFTTLAVVIYLIIFGSKQLIIYMKSKKEKKTQLNA